MSPADQRERKDPTTPTPLREALAQPVYDRGSTYNHTANKISSKKFKN